MGNISASMAKLAGTRKAIQLMLEMDNGRGQPIRQFPDSWAAQHFASTAKELDLLRKNLPDLYGDFTSIGTKPLVETTAVRPATEPSWWYGRSQIERLGAVIDQIFEIRAHSELSVPQQQTAPKRRVFISHGHSNDWRETQAYVEKDIGLDTLELAQEVNQGRTILAKLWEESEKCDSAIIVMTGDDLDAEGQARARENVIHEIGFFQGKYGLGRIVLMREDGVSIPSNIHGVVYTSFPKGTVSASFGLLFRELKTMYK